MRSRQLLLGLALFFLIVWALTMLLLRGVVAYAFSDSTPAPVGVDTVPEPLANRFATVAGTPDHDLAVVYRRYGISSYWYPLVEYGNRIIVRADAPLPRSMEPSPRPFQGRLQRIQQVSFSSFVVDRFLQVRGLRLPPDGYVISLDETPRTFLPMVLMMAPITVAWLGLLIVVVALAVRAAMLRRASASKRA